MRLLRRLIREPLLHFLLAGAALYAGWAHWGPSADASRRIVVDRGALLRFMQYQSQDFEPGAFEARLDAMDDPQRRRLIADYVREESLYREARALGLERGDYVMRQRLVQKMNFLLEPQQVTEPTDAQLQQYLARNAALYRVAASWTFTHVFVDPAVKPGESAESRARALLARLNRERAGFNDAPRFSDRYPYLQNYVDRTGEYVGSHFGAQFASLLAGLPVDASRWQGPLRSDQGWHLVLVTAHAPERDPRFAEIRVQLRDDYRRDAVAAKQDQAVREVVGRYSVEVELGSGQ
ncbi:MAG: peptidyl-prolyl cis-trans isomerase [Proteobacteria bacterium]|jgi:peptidyl-prolyl cis-trans isomerase C|nr:peptidyl-prolyl cis-trans isomerase [Pseudomonadota bacterium]